MLILKSNGYPQNLKDWYDHIQAQAHLKFTSLDDHYLTRDSVPLLIEKAFSFTELNLILEPRLYQANSAPRSTPRLHQTYTKLLSDRKFELQPTTASSQTLLFCLGRFFADYIDSRHSKALIRAAAKSSTADLKAYLSRVLDTLPTFYHTLKRVCVHMNLVGRYTYKNDMTTQFLASFVSSLFTLDRSTCSTQVQSVTKLLEALIENCTELFDLRDTYLKIQVEMIEMSFDLRSLRLAAASSRERFFLVTVFHEEKSFQLNVAEDFTCRQVMMQARDVFGLDESRFLSLLEVFGESSPVGLLERPLSGEAGLIESLSKWESFHLRVKRDVVGAECEKMGGAFVLEKCYEECEVRVVCDGCRRRGGQCAGGCGKWKKCFLSVEERTARIFK